jgi:hypothetical protein
MEEQERAKLRHDVGNALSIARSSVEAMLDGVVGITDPRLNRLRELLSTVSDGMNALTEDAIPTVQQTEKVDADAAFPDISPLEQLAEIKGVQLFLDRGADEPLETILLEALRDAAPGSVMRVANARDKIVVIYTKISTKDS